MVFYMECIQVAHTVHFDFKVEPLFVPSLSYNRTKQIVRSPNSICNNFGSHPPAQDAQSVCGGALRRKGECKECPETDVKSDFGDGVFIQIRG